MQSTQACACAGACDLAAPLHACPSCLGRVALFVEAGAVLATCGGRP
jgi:hypothetical protein